MISGKDVNFNDETHVLTINGEKHAVGDPGEIDALSALIGDISETGLTGDSVADQLADVERHLESLPIIKLDNSVIELEEGVSIITNGLSKQGRHVFGWITLAFPAQSPSSLKLGVLKDGYKTTFINRMLIGFGTQAWSSEYFGYGLLDDNSALIVTGYNISNIRAAHIHLDYVV